MFLVLLCKTFSFNYGMKFVLLSSSPQGSRMRRCGSERCISRCWITIGSAVTTRSGRSRFLWIKWSSDSWRRSGRISNPAVMAAWVTFHTIKVNLWKSSTKVVHSSLSRLCASNRLTLMALFSESPHSRISLRNSCVCVIGKSWRSAVVSVL